MSIGRSHWAPVDVSDSKQLGVVAVPASERLKELRSRLGLTMREVEEFSRTIAEDRQNDDFYISNAWLTQLENKNSVPSIYKLYSLSVIYRAKFNDFLTMFGIDLAGTSRHQLALPPQDTPLIAREPSASERTVSFPIRYDKSFSLETTKLISRIAEVWGNVPVALIQKLDVRHCQYGYIGTQDRSMYPLLRPGSFVRVDSHRSKMDLSERRTAFDRPIYFVEFRDGYACSWCEVRGSQLTLVPHPLSGCTIRQFAYPSEAEIVGQVTGVAMRLVPQDGQVDKTPSLPIPS